MHIKRVSLKNFRNYEHSSVELVQGHNLFIGDNAQGKTNFLEAIEILATGRSDRANQDIELIRNGADHSQCEITFESGGFDQTISMTIQIQGRNISILPVDFHARKSAGQKSSGQQISLNKTYKLNGITQSRGKSMNGKLVVVSFKSNHLNLLRGGPRYRRDWLDGTAGTFRPVYQEVLGKYQKVITQRNQLLKTIFEKGKLKVSDQDQLKVWDSQVASFGSQVIHGRLAALSEIIPSAQQHHERISAYKEILSVKYLFKSTLSKQNEPAIAWEEEVGIHAPTTTHTFDLHTQSQEEIAQLLLRVLKARRAEEIVRKQTLAGPHLDDIQFCLNEADAVSFASQGQQRSLVLSLKLAELKRARERIQEPPILLLDDVFAELDLSRQELLMDFVKDGTQTLITTTHLSNFRQGWFERALILNVLSGSISPAAEHIPIPH